MIEITPKIANTDACGIAAVIIGNKRPTANDPSQLNDDAKPLARPRIANGNTSPTNTQVSGAQVNE